MARLWRRLVPDVHPGWLVAVLAFHPFTVYAAVEIRLYAMAMLLSALLLALFFEEFVGNGGSRHRKMFFAATSIAALWTQFYLGFLLAVQGGVLVLLRRWRAVGSYLAAMAIAAIALAPLVPGVTGELEGHTQGVRERFGVVDQARFVYSRLAYYVLPRETQSPELVKIARDVVMLGATLAVGARLLRRPRPALSRAAFVLATIVAGLMATFVVAILYIGTQELVLVRHTVAVFVPVILLTLVVMAEVGGRRAVIATALVMLTFEVADLAAVYLPRPAKRGDWLAVARYIEANEAPGQPILTFRAPSQLPLAIHYHGPNPIVPVPRPNNRDHWVLEDTQLRSPDDVMRVLNALPGQPRTIWLVTDTIWSTMGISFHHEILEDVVARDFAVKLDRSFFASRARLLERR
jgi:hypothetical protein